MREKLQGIVIHVLRYSDRHNIAHIYTFEHGRMAFLVPQGKTAAARQRNACFMPLSMIRFEAVLKPGRELGTLHDVQRAQPLTSIYCDPRKSAIAMFLSELLNHTIQEHEQNMRLYSYIARGVLLLEQATRGVANFHICFLFHLGALLGIQPDVDGYAEGLWFDMEDGTFSAAPSAGGKWLRPEEARVIYLLSRMTFENMHLFRFNRDQRNAMLDTIIAYFRLHHSAIGTLRSPDVLKQLFA